MNGIAPFRSSRSLIAFLVAPVSPGLLMGLLLLFTLPTDGAGLSSALLSFTLSVAGAALLGYPMAILTAGPLYYFVSRRSMRVGYRHFFIYGLASSLVLNLFLQRRSLFAGSDHADLSDFVVSVFALGILTVFACSVFYLIVRQPENPAKDADTADG
jgi:hypothetical protein